MAEQLLGGDEQGDFVPVDLHVHTPASSDYKGTLGDEGYLDLLTAFRDAGVKVIAITDHNTLAGYREIVRIRRQVETRASVVAELADDHEDMARALEHLKAQLELFDSIVVLPGIELDAKPGIHVLALFDPDQPLDLAEQLLLDAGFPPEHQGREDKDSRAAMSVDDLLDAVVSAGGMPILAHVDRDKGAYKKLDGAFRARVFKSNSLAAVSYCDPASEALLNELLSQREYRRARPLAMFRCSDYHGEEEVGLKLTYMRLPDMKFASFREVIEEPIGRISQTADPGERVVIEEIARSKSSMCFANLKGFDEGGLHAACALLNQWGGGQLLIGVTVRNGKTSVTGVKGNREEVETLIGESLGGINPRPSHRVVFFSYGERIIPIISMGAVGTGRLHYLSESRQAWVLEGGVPVMADAPDVAQIVEENVIKRIAEIQRQPIAEAKRFAAYTPILARSSRFFRLARKIEEQSECVLIDHVRGGYLRMPDTELLPATLTEAAWADHANGLADAECAFVADAPYRLSGAYLRLTVPLFEMDDIEDHTLPAPEAAGPFIVVTPSGGVFFRSQEGSCRVFADGDPGEFVLLNGMNDDDKAVLARIALWMKSAPAIAYLLMDALEPSVGSLSVSRLQATGLYRTLPLPQGLFDDRAKGLDAAGLAIAELERGFLSQPLPESQAEHANIVDRHNLAVDQYAYEVEAIIASILGLDEEDADALDDFLKSRQLYALDGVDAASGRGIQAMPID